MLKITSIADTGSFAGQLHLVPARLPALFLRTTVKHLLLSQLSIFLLIHL